MNPTKKIKLTSDHQLKTSHKKIFDLTSKARNDSYKNDNNHLTISNEVKSMIKEPKVLIKHTNRKLKNVKGSSSRFVDETNDSIRLLHIDRKSNSSSSETTKVTTPKLPLKNFSRTISTMPSSNNKFKVPTNPPTFGSFKSLMPPSRKSDKPSSSNNFKAPMSHSFNHVEASNTSSSDNSVKPFSNNDFKAPLPTTPDDGFKTPIAPTPDDNLKTSMDLSPVPEFKAPNTIFTKPQQNELATSRLTHYINCICDDLDQYNENKQKMADSLLTFRDTDDLPTLDITIMRKITSLVSSIIKQYKNLELIDMVKFGKIIRLMENTVIIATDIDIIELCGKNPTEDNNKESILKLLTLISDGLEACFMIFEILTTCNLDKQFLSRNLITNCLHFIKNQLDFTIYPLIDLSHFEDEATSLTTSAHAFFCLIESSSKERHLLSTFVPLITRFFRRAFTFILSEDLDDDVLVIVAYISMGPFFHDYSESHKSILLVTDNYENLSFNPYEQLKFVALDILKHIFSKYPKHRRWIFEEILTSIGSLTTMEEARKYRLRDNRSIHVISALFMQLVQCCSSLSDKVSHKNWFMKWNIKYQKAIKGQDEDQIKMLDDKLVRRATTAWRLGAEAATNSASFFLEFLMSK
ncbi:uncharacterized protein BX663DRAFT_172351 [Cokeromyces recurvatus]|uniref:uncharacterized protein n=1 Tax=Cokeromyces recurvatus TaxID=90255 RepID=UPI0022207ED2|nr:uncharacterized protein BX663DRAFT_172351 [Cokeromyces recurvatus]KAI7900012.1 hypothetical protein BX663DRAFT_172351 [Cokeromyces recurvatus]